MKYKNVYFINGNAYAGKSTMVKMLASKYDGILCAENYHDSLRYTLDKNEFSALTYTRDLKDWSHFIIRSPDEYEDWINKVTEECTILELRILDDLIKENKKIFVDTNIPIDVLKEISDEDHVIIMLAEPEVSINKFFDRPDKEKQFLYQLLLKEDNQKYAIENFRNCLKRINSKENYNEFLNSGFHVIKKDDSRTKEETLAIIENLLKLK